MRTNSPKSPPASWSAERNPLRTVLSAVIRASPCLEPLSHSEILDTAFTLISAKARPCGRAFSLSSLESNMGLTSPLLSNMERHLLYRGRGDLSSHRESCIFHL